MRFGIRLIQHLGSPRDIVNLGILADQSGFDQAWFPSDKFMYHAWSIIAALAENTKKIVVGAMRGVEVPALCWALSVLSVRLSLFQRGSLPEPVMDTTTTVSAESTNFLPAALIGCQEIKMPKATTL